MQNKQVTQEMSKQEEQIMKKTVIYIRHTEDRPGPSIEEQRAACRKYAAEHGHTVITEYIDQFEKGHNRNCYALIRMKQHTKMKRFDRILIYSADQFSMDAVDFALHKAWFEQYGVSLISVTHSASDDLMYALLQRIICAYENYRHAEHSAKVKRGMQLAKERKAALAAAEKQADI